MRIQAIFNKDGGTFRTTDMDAYVRHAEKVFGDAGHHLDCDVVEHACQPTCSGACDSGATCVDGACVPDCIR